MVVRKRVVVRKIGCEWWWCGVWVVRGGGEENGWLEMVVRSMGGEKWW